MSSRTASISASGLRAARMRAGLTQAVVAEHLGIDVTQVSRWERGLNEPRPSYIPRVAALYRIPPERLLVRAARDTLLGARLARGLTTLEVSAQTGLALARYNRIERYGTDPDALTEDARQALASCLGLSPEGLDARLAR